MSESALQRLQEWRADVAVILGSGLNDIVPKIGADRAVAYSDFEELARPSVPGHEGRFVLGEIARTRIIYAQGRVHLYEGHSARDVAGVVRVLASAGVKQLLLTNAAGTANPNFAPGSWMMITDHINLTGVTPLLGTTEFIDMTDAYSPRLRARFARAAAESGISLHEGIYAGLFGPQYETPAEVRMLRSLGADAIGMSTVIEVIQACALGLEVAGFSCLTNLAAGMSNSPLTHSEVLAAGARAAGEFSQLLTSALAITQNSPVAISIL